MTNLNIPAEKVIEQLRRQLDVANFQLAQATVAAETMAERAAEAENRLAEMDAPVVAASPEK